MINKVESGKRFSIVGALIKYLWMEKLCRWSRQLVADFCCEWSPGLSMERFDERDYKIILLIIEVYF